MPVVQPLATLHQEAEGGSAPEPVADRAAVRLDPARQFHHESRGGGRAPARDPARSAFRRPGMAGQDRSAPGLGLDTSTDRPTESGPRTREGSGTLSQSRFLTPLFLTPLFPSSISSKGEFKRARDVAEHQTCRI